MNGKFKSFSQNGITLDFPGGLAWANKTKSLVIGGQRTAGSALYHVKANGDVTGSTVLGCSSGDCAIAQVTVKGKYIVAGRRVP